MKSRFAITAVLCMLALQVAAVDASDRYRSPRNAERKIRQSTELIVLHTTEAPARGSLLKLSERGECHFCVTEDGSIYRIVDRDRVAFHAGRSMWHGKEDVDNISVGIECVGYHDKEMPLVQLYAIRDLVRDLKAMYRLTDERVVCHGHVAYGAPNKWQKRRHRGRKRCGMLFAMPSVRKLLELKSRPAVDLDVRANRLVVGDPYLSKVLYGGTDTMRKIYADAAAVPEKKPEAPITERIVSLIRNVGASGEAEKRDPKPPPAVVQRTPAAQPRNAPRPFKRLPQNESDLRNAGYVPVGVVSRARTASSIAGARWNAATTYYTIRNKVIPGNMIDARHIEVGMNIWMKRR